MNTKEKIEVMQAFLDGKKIECKFTSAYTWSVMDGEPKWDWVANDYRIAPEPKWNWVVVFSDMHGNLSSFVSREKHATEDDLHALVGSSVFLQAHKIESTREES